MTKKEIGRFQGTAQTGLKCVVLDIDTVQSIVITGASFSKAREMRSELAFVKRMADVSGKSYLIHYGSNCYKRVTRSVMESELQACIVGFDFDFDFILRDILAVFLGRRIYIVAVVDRKTVFGIIAKVGNTDERRLHIDVFALREYIHAVS